MPAHDAPPAGFAFQDARLQPWLTAVQNILAVAGKPPRPRPASCSGTSAFSGYERAYPRELSGGMQRRVALARAFSVNPRLLLLDEPFVSLDRNLVTEMQEVFLELVRRSSPIVILATHLPEDAARLADRAVVLGGMPARIASDVMLSPPRDERSVEDLQRLAGAIAHSHPETHP